MVAEYAIDRLSDTENTWAEFAEVDVLVLAPVRTLLEKLALLHDAACRFSPDSREQLLRSGRHLYDVHQILSADRVLTDLTDLGTEGVSELSADIDRRSEDARFPHTARPAAGYAGSPLFEPGHRCLHTAAEGYAAASRLVYGARPSFDDCINKVRSNAHLL